MSHIVERRSSPSRSNSVVAFYFPDRRALGGADPLTLEPDRDWAMFGTGLYVWILQTFLRLRAAGAPVELVDRAPADGIVVIHADHFDRVFAEAPSPARLTIVIARSDRPPQPMADFGIVQNAGSADHYHFFIPSWLQPGLIPRMRERGTRVENVAYVGSIRELDPELSSAEWTATLDARGLRWDARTIAFAGNDQLYRQHRWNDCAQTDVIVALRPPRAWDLRSKPAAKLQNAWAAGVPAIVSPERPYRELRRSSLDYFEAKNGTDVLAALDTLRSDPGLYADMVQNGLERAREFRPDRLVARWSEVLWEEISERAARPTHRILSRARRWRAVARRVNRWTFGPSSGAATRVDRPVGRSLGVSAADRP
jgi:hypothetical protein